MKARAGDGPVCCLGGKWLRPTILRSPNARGGNLDIVAEGIGVIVFCGENAHVLSRPAKHGQPPTLHLPLGRTNMDDEAVVYMNGVHHSR